MPETRILRPSLGPDGLSVSCGCLVGMQAMRLPSLAWLIPRRSMRMSPDRNSRLKLELSNNIKHTFAFIVLLH